MTNLTALICGYLRIGTAATFIWQLQVCGAIFGGGVGLTLRLGSLGINAKSASRGSRPKRIPAHTLVCMCFSWSESRTTH